MHVIIVAGEALVDLVPQHPGVLAPLTPAPGGGPFNTAVALARLGSPVAFLSRVSTDDFGAELLGRLRESGAETAYVQRGPEPTPLAVASLGEGGSASWSFYAEGTADRLFTVPGRLPETVRAACFGTCSLVLEPGASAYTELMARLADEGVFTLLDPNIRTGLIPDHDAYRQRFGHWLGSTTVLKVSEEDAEWLGGTPGEWVRSGPAAVVVTRGGAGLSVTTREGELAVPGVTVEVADTIGAGDTVNAALLHGLEEHEALSPDAVASLGDREWREVLTLAARAAAVTCSRPGADPPYAHELTEVAGRAG